jgi:hypothetical protein
MSSPWCRPYHSPSRGRERQPPVYQVPGAGYFFLNLIVETQVYFQKWRVAPDAIAELVDSIACQPKFLGL